MIDESPTIVFFPPMRSILSTVLLCLTIAPPLVMAQPQPRARDPNTTVMETLIGYGRTKQRAEMSALNEAERVSFDGEYELKSIGLGGRDDDFYCIIKIRHDIYRPENRRAVEEVTVGYGEDLMKSEQDARFKAERMIARRLRSAAERRARRQAMENLQFGRGSDSESPTILDKDDDTSFILKSIRFSGRPGDYQCYITFEYLVHQ